MKISHLLAMGAVLSMSDLSLAGPFGTPSLIDPAQAMDQALQVAQQEVLRELRADGRFYEASVTIGKYSAHRAADYRVTLGVTDLSTEQPPMRCQVAIMIQRVPFAKQRDLILEQVINDYQIIAKVLSAHCNPAQQ